MGKTKGKMKTKLQNRIYLMNRLTALGFSYDEANQLRRIEMTLHRWAELECGDSNAHCSFGIERDEQTGKPFNMIRPHHCNGYKRNPIADRERGALKRLDAIIAKHPGIVRYQQGDPRGCALYILRQSDVDGHDIHSVYTRGIAVCD